jgi:hypothetical protein
LAENFRTSGQCNKYFKVALDKYMSKNENTKRQYKNKVSRIKYQTCYTCRDKSHLSKDCHKTQTFIHKIVNNNIPHLGPKNDTDTIKVVSSPCDSYRDIWVPKHLLTNHEGPNKAWVSNFLDQVVGRLKYIGSLTIKKEDGIITISSSVRTFMQI